MGKTYRTLKNTTHENARPYERTRENLTRNISYLEVESEDPDPSMEHTYDNSDFGN